MSNEMSSAVSMSNEMSSAVSSSPNDDCQDMKNNDDCLDMKRCRDSFFEEQEVVPPGSDTESSSEDDLLPVDIQPPVWGSEDEDGPIMSQLEHLPSTGFPPEAQLTQSSDSQMDQTQLAETHSGPTQQCNRRLNQSPQSDPGLEHPQQSDSELNQSQPQFFRTQQSYLQQPQQDYQLHQPQGHHQQVYSQQSQPINWDNSQLYLGNSYQQYPMQFDPRYAILTHQVQSSPSPQPYGQPVMMQASPIITPRECIVQMPSNTPSIVDQQPYLAQQESFSDTQSVRSGITSSSGFWSIVNSPAVPISQPYWDSSVMNPVLISTSVPTPRMSPTQVKGEPDLQKHGYLNNHHPQQCVLPQQMACNITTAGTAVPRKYSCPNIQTTTMRTQTNITPTQQTQCQDKNGERKEGAKAFNSNTSYGEEGNIWTDNCDYTEYKHEKYSNLYITWDWAKSQLFEKLGQLNLIVKFALPTKAKNVWNVVFDTHANARKAFTTQREIQVRMVPPRGSKRNWFRNPSPRFLVKYQTKVRLDVRKGKAICHDLVGTLLMSNCKTQKGCIIWADQLKGHRIRIVGCIGNFMLPSKKKLKMNEIPKKSKNHPIGWVSYRNKTTREEYVTQMSGNSLTDYIYNE
jgi:hypothetical protein